MPCAVGVSALTTLLAEATDPPPLLNHAKKVLSRQVLEQTLRQQDNPDGDPRSGVRRWQERRGIHRTATTFGTRMWGGPYIAVARYGQQVKSRPGEQTAGRRQLADRCIWALPVV